MTWSIQRAEPAAVLMFQTRFLLVTGAARGPVSKIGSSPFLPVDLFCCWLGNNAMDLPINLHLMLLNY